MNESPIRRCGGPARRFHFAQLLAVALTLGVASCTGASEVCSPQDPLCDPGVGSGPVFPAIAQSVVDAVCIRGESVPTTSESGSVTSADCLSSFGDGYFEAWRVRVGSNANVTFDVSSNFDSLLEVYRVDDPNDYLNSAVLIAEDDDSKPDLNARLTTPLVTNTEYLVLIGGFDDFEQGPYTLSMTAL